MKDWKWRVYLFVRVVDATPANRQALAQIYVNHGSGQTLEEEMEILNTAARFSTSGAEPAQVFGLNIPAKTEMKDEFQALLAGLTQAGWAVVSNIKTPSIKYLELTATNFPVTPAGQRVTWAQALQYLENQYGLHEIEPELP